MGSALDGKNAQFVMDSYGHLFSPPTNTLVLETSSPWVLYLSEKESSVKINLSLVVRRRRKKPKKRMGEARRRKRGARRKARGATRNAARVKPIPR